MKPIISNKPHMIVVVGIPGSGKSFFAEHFAATFKAPLISYDRLRTELTTDCDENVIASNIANYLLEEVLKTGRTVVYDGQTDLRTERALIAKKSRDSGYEPLFIWVQTESVTAKKRATKPNSDKTNLSTEQFDIKFRRFSPPHQIEKAIVISGKHTYSSQLKIVLKHLVEPRAQVVEPMNHPRPHMIRNTLIR